MKPRSTTLCIALIAVLTTAAAAQAQWVSFSDDTGTRLSLQPFVDNPGGNPMNDGEEKDIAAGDLDQDGDDDVIVVRKLPFSNHGARQDVLLINDNGNLVDMTATFAPEFLTTLTDARDVVIADFTGDGWLDVVIGVTFGVLSDQQPQFYRNLGEDGGGNWLGLVNETAARFPVLDPDLVMTCAVSAGDVTGNGALDIYMANYEEFGGADDFLLINDGSGFFTDESQARLGNLRKSAFGTAAEIHDVDNDGDNDIIKISTLYSAGPFPIGQFILFNDGNGVFNTVPHETLGTASPYHFTAGHLNGDDLIDYFNVGDVQDRTNIVTSVVPDTAVNYNEVTVSSRRTGGFGGNVKLADVDNDGDLDVGIAPVDVDIQNCPNPGDFALLQNNGNGAFSDPWAGNDDQNFHAEAHDFHFLDINGDGCLDIFMGKCTGWNVFIQENCEGGGLCADVDKFQARCNALGTIQMRLTLTNNNHDGEMVTFGIDQVPHEATIFNNVASFQMPGAGSGSHRITLEDPASCQAPIKVTCP